jgi:hypothetical protein
MRQTVVGTFARPDAARAAIAALAADRFAPDQVHALEPRPAPAPAAAPHDDHGVLAHVRHFIADALGLDEAGMARGGAIVRVDAIDSPQAVRAELAFVRAGAVDITRQTIG